jgi:hypothetical protein
MQPLPVQPRRGAQEFGDGVTHLPFMQVDAAVSAFAPVSHFAGLQTVPSENFWQAPFPSHFPLVPQEAAPWFTHVFLGSSWPASAGVHVPRAFGSAHV